MNKIAIPLLLPLFLIASSFTLRGMSSFDGGQKGKRGANWNQVGQGEGEIEFSSRTASNSPASSEHDNQQTYQDDRPPQIGNDQNAQHVRRGREAQNRINGDERLRIIEEAQQAIQESLTHCSAASSCFFSDLKPIQDALKALSSKQEEALTGLREVNINELNELLKKAQEACGMEATTQGEANLDEQLQRQLEQCQAISDYILSTVVPFDHRDPLHPSKWCITDAMTFPLILPTAFGMPTSDCLMAGVGANLIGTLTASPWLFDRIARKGSGLLCAKSPEKYRQTIDAFSSFFRKYMADSDYLGYYLPGWVFLKIVNKDPEFLKSFITSRGILGSMAREGTLLAGFIIPSSLARKATSLFIQSPLCRNSLSEEAGIITAKEPERSLSCEAFRGVTARFLPDIMAATTRSFLSNLYDHYQGKITMEEVYSKTAYSAGVYTVATMGFYALYRLAEVMMWRSYPTQARYQEYAARDKASLEKLESVLNSVAPETGGATNTTNALSPRDIVMLSQSLQFLNSPVTNFLGDPIYRMTSTSSNALRALDAIKLLKRAVPSLTSDDATEKEEAYSTLQIISNYLAQNGDIETGNPSSNDETTRIVPFSNEIRLDALINLFNSFSASSPSRKMPHPYNAINGAPDS